MRPPAVALLALLAAACGGDHECCAFPNDVRVEAVDEAGGPVPDAAVELARIRPPRSLAEGFEDGGVLDSRVERTDSTGVVTFYSEEDSAFFRVTIAPPPGFALADSTRAAQTLLHYRATSVLRFVLRRLR